LLRIKVYVSPLKKPEEAFNVTVSGVLPECTFLPSLFFKIKFACDGELVIDTGYTLYLL
jgi:hypothetical protein